MAIGTKNINDEPKEGTPKTFKPGNISAKINSVKLEKISWKEGAYSLVLNLEGPDLGDDFEGFQIDKDRPELGKAKGQVGRVKADKWPFSSGRTKSGIEIDRDTEILKFVKTLCKAMGKLDWFEAVDNKYNTIEEFVAAFDNEAPFKNLWFNWCICGKEYMGKTGYMNYDMYLPKANKVGIPFELEHIDSGKVFTFDANVHIEKMKEVKAVESFSDNTSSGDLGSSDITLNDDFEL